MANLIGWKDITQYANMSKSTINLKIKKFSFPVDKSTGVPISTTQLIDKWFEDRIRKTVERRKKPREYNFGKKKDNTIPR